MLVYQSRRENGTIDVSSTAHRFQNVAELKKALKNSNEDFLANVDDWNMLLSNVSRVRSKTIAGIRNHLKFVGVRQS